MNNPIEVKSKRDQDIRVLHVIAINGIGGAEKFVVELLETLEKRKITVACLIFYRIVTSNSAKELGKQLQANGVQVFYKDYTRILDKRNFRYLHNFIKATDYNIIHSHLKHADVWVSILKLRNKILVPVVSTAHGYNDTYQNKYGLLWNRKAYLSGYYWLTRFVYSHMTAIVFLSRSLYNFFKEANLVSRKKTCKVIYHATSLKRKILETPVSKDVTEVVLNGRLVRSKGHEYAIEAIKILRQRNINVTLHFYGVGPEEERLRKFVESKNLQDVVFFHGFVKDILGKISQHHIAIVPSIGEAFGLVFLDAFKAGLPVVTFDLPACNEIIIDGHNGLLAKPFDANSLSEKIEILIADEILKKKLVENAFLYLDNFSIDKSTSAYISFYRELVENGHAVV